MADEQSICLSLSFSISETKHVIKGLTTHVTVTLEVLINKSIKNILLLPRSMFLTRINRSFCYFKQGCINFLIFWDPMPVKIFSASNGISCKVTEGFPWLFLTFLMTCRNNPVPLIKSNYLWNAELNVYSIILFSSILFSTLWLSNSLKLFIFFEIVKLLQFYPAFFLPASKSFCDHWSCGPPYYAALTLSFNINGRVEPKLNFNPGLALTKLWTTGHWRINSHASIRQIYYKEDNT